MFSPYLSTISISISRQKIIKAFGSGCPSGGDVIGKLLRLIRQHPYMVVADLDVAAGDVQRFGLAGESIRQLAVAELAEQGGVAGEDAHFSILARNLGGFGALAGEQLFGGDDVDLKSIGHGFQAFFIFSQASSTSSM